MYKLTNVPVNDVSSSQEREAEGITEPGETLYCVSRKDILEVAWRQANIKLILSEDWNFPHHMIAESSHMSNTMGLPGDLNLSV